MKNVSIVLTNTQAKLVLAAIKARIGNTGSVMGNVADAALKQAALKIVAGLN